MKTLLALLVTLMMFSSCKKDTPVEIINTDLNPVAVKIIVDSTSSIFIRVQ